MKKNIIKSGDFHLGTKAEEDILLHGGGGGGSAPAPSYSNLTGTLTNSDYLPDELELREGHDQLGRDSAKFYKILNKRVTAFKIIVKVGSLYFRKTDGPSDYEGETAPKVGKGDMKRAEVVYRIDYSPYFSDETKNEEFFPRNDADEIEQNTDNEITQKTKNRSKHIKIKDAKNNIENKNKNE